MLNYCCNQNPVSLLLSDLASHFMYATQKPKPSFYRFNQILAHRFNDSLIALFWHNPVFSLLLLLLALNQSQFSRQSDKQYY